MGRPAAAEMIWAGSSTVSEAGPVGLLQPLLGIAVLALALKIPGLVGGGAAGGNIVMSLVDTAVGAAVGAGAGMGVRAALSVVWVRAPFRLELPHRGTGASRRPPCPPPASCSGRRRTS
jgi:hypothetical protein